jgi:hypothetical protein
MIAQSVQCWATGWTIGVLGFDSWKGLETFIFTTASRTALGFTQPPIQLVPGTLSLGVKHLGREADRSFPCSAEIKECGELYLHSPNTPSWCGAQLKEEAQRQLYLYCSWGDWNHGEWICQNTGHIIYDYKIPSVLTEICSYLQGYALKILMYGRHSFCLKNFTWWYCNHLPFCILKCWLK